ncbi:MAG: response regulator [Cyclobacteriaceae bacterium]
MQKYFVALLLIYIFGLGETLGQAPKIKSIGVPLISNYGPEDYDFSNQNFAILSGQDGRMYFGNYEGILIYDGNAWSKIILPGGAPVYGLAQTPDGRIYVGGTNEMGYLESDPSGQLVYRSIMEKLKSDSLSSFTTRPSVFDQDKVIFSCLDRMVLIDPDKPEIEVIPAPIQQEELYLFDPHVVGDKYFAYKNDTLLKLINKQWQPIKPSQVLSGILGQGRIIDLSNQESIIITQAGFFDFKTEERIDIPQETELFLSDAFIYDLNLLAERYIAISTWKGLLITDLEGKSISFLDKSRGLEDNILFGTAVDASGMLWVATNNGINKIDIFSPYSFMNEQMGIESVVIDTRVFNDKLYLGTMSGLMTVDWLNLANPFLLPQFQYENHMVNHGFISSNEDIIVLTEFAPNMYMEGHTLKEIEGTNLEIFWNGFISRTEDHAFLGSLQGKMVNLEKNQNTWRVKAVVDPLFKVAQWMAEGTGNDIWVGNDQEGIFKIVYDREAGKILSQKKYTEADGLPSDFGNYVFKINDQPVFSTEKGVYSYDQQTDRIVPNSAFAHLAEETIIIPIYEGSDGEVYCFSDHLFQWKRVDNIWVKERFPALDFRKFHINSIYALDSANVLLATTNGVIHLDPRYQESKEPFTTHITEIADLQNLDSVFYGGFGSPPDQLNFAANQRSFRFSYTALDYQNEKENTYQWRLIGFDENWSDWSSDNSKDYTNLAHGSYTFSVKSMNINGVESDISSIRFTIATPWYFTVWAYLVYVSTFFLLIWFIVKMYTAKIRADRDRLEKVVEERTLEINEQKNELLKMDDLKKRFFVNISHELRTPLTLSMGTVDQALKGAYGNLNDELYANLQVSKRNSERLLKMVTSILDISKLEGGRIQLYAALVDTAGIATKVLAFFSSRLSDKHISLEENLIHGTELYIDRDKFETILINLLSNAFKFTPNGGVISFSMRNIKHEIIFEIKDSGPGIPESDLNLVFDRFYQSPTIKSGEGMGVGLALTKELVELHHGSVSAKNDGGAVFTLAFPKGKDHLSPNQIVNQEESTTSRNMADKYPLRDNSDITIIPKKVHDAQAEHILLVEDNWEMRQFISSILSPHYQVSWAEDGEKGLEFLKESKPDLIITDYLMPNMDGYEMALEIKKSNDLAFIPIVFLTARAREQDKINVLNLGVDDYLYKPFSTDELLVRVKNLLFNKKHRREYIEEQEIDSSEITWKDFDSKLKQDIDSYIQENLKSQITGDDLAKIAGHSERSLYRKVKANTGLSLMSYVKEYRLRQARSLLENKELPTVSEVSYAVGFNYLSHFTKSYKERFGKQPSEYLE